MTPRYPQTAVAPFASNDDLFVYLMYWPERMLVAEVLPAYPAHLHIDLLPPHQGKGFGRKLIQAFASAAGRAGAPGVHVTVSNENERAHGFYLKVGFTKLDVPGAEDDGVTYYGLETA
jgi:GNAT superfamily N-acetyltransferase